MSVSPKRLQREGRLNEALGYYVSEYVTAAAQGDRFLSTLLMDEIAHTLILKHQQKNEVEPTMTILQHDIRQTLEDKMQGRHLEELEEDIEIELRKRFEEEFEEAEEDP